MKKILLSLFIVTISFLLSSCSKSVPTTLPPRTISRLKPYEYYSEYILLVTINHEDSLKFIDYTIKDFKIDNIRAICECTGYVLNNNSYNNRQIKEFNEESNQNYYKTQTMDNFKRKFMIFMDYPGIPNYTMDKRMILDDADKLLQKCDFVESAELYNLYNNNNDINSEYYIYYDDKIIVKLMHDESAKLKDYSVEDFGIENIESIEETTYNYDEYYELFKKDENEVHDTFYRSFILHMNYKDVEKIKEDAETLFNKNSFIREVLIGNNNFPKDEVSQRVIVTVVLSHEESMKFKDYTKEDFEGTRIYTYGILNIVDLTHVYKEIIDSGNQYYDSSKYRKVLMITLKQNSLVSAYLINEIRFDSIDFDFIDGGGYYPYVSESEYRYE